MISDHIRTKILAELSEAQFWASMVDESTDVTQFQQYLTFVRYVHRGMIKTKFLDTRRLDARGATGENLFKYWTDVAADYDLSIEDHVAIGCDGARAMIGANNSLVSRIRSYQPNILPIHCWNHRAALACADSVEELAVVKRFESTLLNLWHYFHKSALRASILAEKQALNATSARTLKAACKTRWLSHGAAVVAAKSEIIAVWEALEHMKHQRSDPTADGLLRQVCVKQFIAVLYLLSLILPHLNDLSTTYQQGALHFGHLLPALKACKTQLTYIFENNTAWTELKNDWVDRFQTKLGILTEVDEEFVKNLTKTYTDSLISNLNDRFKENDLLLLGDFDIFDPQRIPSDDDKRAAYGDTQIRNLVERFPMVGKMTTVIAHWHSFLEHAVHDTALLDLPDAASLCQYITKSTFYGSHYSQVCKLATIALTIPFSTAWNERGFSKLTVIKTKSRNRLLDSTLAALLNVSINGPEHLSDKEVLEIAEEWIITKDRRKSLSRKRLLVTDTDEDVLDDDSEYCGFEINESDDELDMNVFWT